MFVTTNHTFECEEAKYFKKYPNKFNLIKQMFSPGHKALCIIL